MLFRATTALAAVVVALFAGCSSSSGSGSGLGGSCPCTVGNSGLRFTIPCGQSSCITLNGQVQGYRCESDGAHDDPSACTNGAGGTSGAGGGGNCASNACNVPAPACGSVENACPVAEACATCSGGDLCNVQNACIKPAVQSVAIFGDYAGGAFSINVDQDVPGLAIGLVSYQPMQVTLTGPYASNVVAVFHVGYDGGTTVSGVSAAEQAEGLSMSAPSDAGPPLPLVCDTGTTGCGPASAVEAFFTDHLGGSVLLHRCQYAAYTGTLNVSQGGSCP
jgi:hypothetical protein